MPELDEAIASAAEEIIQEGKDKGNLTEESGVTSPTTEEIPVEEQVITEEEQDLNEDQVKEARILYKALLDPNQRVAILGALAAQAGITIGGNTPQQEIREEAKAKKALTTLIKEALPEFPALADKLAPAIEEFISQEREEQQAEVQQLQIQNLENTVQSEINSLNRELKGTITQSVANRMGELAGQYLMGPDVTVKDYIRSLYTLATAGRTNQRTSQQIADRIRRNATNAPDRLRSAPGSDQAGKIPDKKMSLNESVRWAIEQSSKR